MGTKKEYCFKKAIRLGRLSSPYSLLLPRGRFEEVCNVAGKHSRGMYSPVWELLFMPQEQFRCCS